MPADTVREVLARALCSQGRQMCSCREDADHFICRLCPSKARGADAALAALRSAPEATRLALIRDLLPATHAVVPVKQGVMEMEQTTAGMRAAMLEQIAEESDAR